MRENNHTVFHPHIFILLTSCRFAPFPFCCTMMVMSPFDTNAASLLIQAQDMCREHHALLLFLTRFGSHLYGTETPGISDLDIRGIFLPSPAALAQGWGDKGLHVTTGDGLHKNRAQDVDMDLVPVQRWLSKLPHLDIPSLDLLFAPTCQDCILYVHPAMNQIFQFPLKLVDSAQGTAYVDYVLNQAKKYGIRGSRLGALLGVSIWLEAQERDDNARLEHYLTSLLAACQDEGHCRLEAGEKERYFVLAGKYYQTSLRMKEFAQRVREEMKRHGNTVRLAQQGLGIDYKALSHGLRALFQVQELLETGTIQFPLRQREILCAVKQGTYPWPTLEQWILLELKHTRLLQASSIQNNEYEPGWAELQINELYQKLCTPSG